MGSSSSPLHIMDDDDEFDWAAAVQEIDVACQATNAEGPSTSNSDFSLKRDSGKVMNSVQEMQQKGDFRAHCSSVSLARQSTLDRFIGVAPGNSKKSVGKAECSYQVRGNNGDGNVFGDNNANGSGYGDIEMINGVVRIDPEAAKTWIYPANVPHRDYQFSITRTALFSNTLVVLPTGLGKTLIAAVVMYNYFRWFPEGKIVFAAPSRPLVMQQIEACHNIVGIPQEWTIDLTGQTSPSKRAEFWKTKRVFFVTPQVLERDIHSGSCLVKHLICLVIDEAHRAMGNYSYCVAVRELMDAPVQLRILALTATPGCKQQTIQHIINNLQISTLEYRSDSDPDVLPHVHDRKIEMIEVPMGKEAVEINNLLLEVAHPFVSRLGAFGVLQKRDFQTFSPCDLLNSRDRFRQEPPVGLPHTKYGEIEGCFGVLITLYHVRKLLSSHGIRPAYEMLDEKMKQGSFARMMCRNEVILKAKLLMQQTVNHGAPSPKLAKMLEVLIDHFKVKDPKTSRVIIFSNFRGSVRDILKALVNIGDVVKATEFIGQSSGKTLKGQSQKVQQAVLQKFRTGGYNVIVATSIGEEGLDIMEVDLVICFDANVSPLRMIQRMGRTGRKHEGRVVVLACEGSELKGYMRKQANSKSIKKHMRNNGLNSFDFHPSPRMVPHVFKPEVQLLEMSIEEFVPRGKKMKDDNAVPVPAYKTRLTDAETELLAKYFSSAEETTWRPSLIAFPHFQAFPSPVNKVIHSSRTRMLIDMMQSLQGLTFSNDSKILSEEEEDTLNDCLRFEVVKPHDKVIEDKFSDPTGENLNTEMVEAHTDVEDIAEVVQTEDTHKQGPCRHSLLFGSEFVSVDDDGNVLIMSLPKLSLESDSHVESSIIPPPYYLIDDPEDNKENILQVNHSSTHLRSPQCEKLLQSSPCRLGVALKWKKSEADEILPTQISSRILKEVDTCDENHNDVRATTVIPLPDSPLPDESCNDLSPRLTNFIKSGVVPESPVNAFATSNGDRSNFTSSALISSPNLGVESLHSWEHDEKAVQDGALCKMDDLCLNDNNIPPMRTSASPVAIDEEVETPMPKPTETNSSKDLLFDSGVKAGTVEQRCKLKRLRKHADLHKIPKLKEQTDLCGKQRNFKGTACASTTNLHKGGRKQAKSIAAFIEEEAEISSEAVASDDEEDDEEGSSYEDSFIDDGANTTSAATPAGDGGTDMMAIYRRSLLSQSPFQRLPDFAKNFSPDSVAQSSRMDEDSGRASGTQHDHTPQPGLESTAKSSQHAGHGSLTGIGESKLESRKRKLGYYQAQSVPAVNLDQMFSLLHQEDVANSTVETNAGRMEENRAIFDDDEFYQGIDLDAVEEEAARLLRYKSECSTQKTATVSEPVQQDVGFMDSPSFDLGI
ncbi:DEAD-box ATP-dependent RNA helicase FANCM [Andrographis paniculata]|uniref:DEAD-box ATP-dependent RNA helicase FANCM n=1 Tax=Andrographis paniculata TaxID=175694 RepID=UPI0021E94737|nr:DEAD-box ATP-dependent RNA helicase FANCM [Andrographis paniculata]